MTIIVLTWADDIWKVIRVAFSASAVYEMMPRFQ